MNKFVNNLILTIGIAICTVVLLAVTTSMRNVASTPKYNEKDKQFIELSQDFDTAKYNKGYLITRINDAFDVDYEILGVKEYDYNSVIVVCDVSYDNGNALKGVIVSKDIDEPFVQDYSKISYFKEMYQYRH